MGMGNLRKPDERRARLDSLTVVIRRGKESDQLVEVFRRALRCVNAFAPLQQRGRVHPAERQPSINVFECDGKVGGVCADMRCNALPAEDSVFATKMMIVT